MKEILNNKNLNDNEKVEKLNNLGYTLTDILIFIMKNY